MSSISELILNSGPFSPVWIAGTMKDKIGKKVVLSTDIADIAEKIMSEDRINLVLRLSGMLLKGLVVVYSKKTMYMLSDCEDIITKIMQSFKTNAVNLPPQSRSGEAHTIPNNPQIQTVNLDSIGDIDKWLKEMNPEEAYYIKQPPLELPSQSENSQILTQLSESSSSLSSTPSSQMLFSDTLVEPIPPPQTTGQDFEQLPVPQWSTDNDVVQPVFEDIDDNPIDEPLNEPINDQTETETETESTTDNDREKQRSRIVDSQIDLPNVRGQHRRRARAPATIHKGTALPQNEELEELFDLAKQEFNKPPQQQETDLENSDFAMPAEEVRYDNLPDVSDSDIPEQQDFSDNEDNMRKISLPSTPNDYLDISRRNKLSAEQTPNSVKLYSPYPNIQFAIEKTPRRSVEDSITKETISVLNKVRKGLKDKESITFNQAFQGSSRHGAAAAFYQLLVLRSTGYTINVEQESPYEPINIRPGPTFLST